MSLCIRLQRRATTVGAVECDHHRPGGDHCYDIFGQRPRGRNLCLWHSRHRDGTCLDDRSPVLKNEVHKRTKDDNRGHKQGLVLEAFDTLFNKRDYKAAERYWSPNYIQHSAHIKPGRDGLFDLIRSSPATLRYESGTIVAEGDYVIVHGRFIEHWKAEELDRCRYRPRGRRPARGTLGRFAGRSDRGRVAKRSADVRDQISQWLTFCIAYAMSALGHKRTCAAQKPIS